MCAWCLCPWRKHSPSEIFPVPLIWFDFLRGRCVADDTGSCHIHAWPCSPRGEHRDVSSVNPPMTRWIGQGPHLLLLISQASAYRRHFWSYCLWGWQNSPPPAYGSWWFTHCLVSNRTFQFVQARQLLMDSCRLSRMYSSKWEQYGLWIKCSSAENSFEIFLSAA